MSEFRIGTPTYQHRTTHGRVVTCTVVLYRPSALLVGGVSFRFEISGYRVADRRRAAVYGSNTEAWLWDCDGEVIGAGALDEVANNLIK